MIGLTAPLLNCKNYITACIAEDGVPPSHAEIMKFLGLASRGGVNRMLAELEERGHIRRLPRRARAIEIVDHRNCPHCHNLLGSLACLNAAQADPVITYSATPSALSSIGTEMAPDTAPSGVAGDVRGSHQQRMGGSR